MAAVIYLVVLEYLAAAINVMHPEDGSSSVQISLSLAQPIAQVLHLQSVY